MKEHNESNPILSPTAFHRKDSFASQSSNLNSCFSFLGWLLVTPAVFALGTFLPNAKEVGALLPQHRWFAGFVGFSEFDLRRVLLVFSLWVLAWTMSRRNFDLPGSWRVVAAADRQGFGWALRHR